MSESVLTYAHLRAAVEGTAAAFRAVTDLDPAGGDGDKLFPPTYEGGVYARETRIIAGQPTPCVLLDSVQSQANRLELALLEWHRGTAGESERPFPLVQIDFSGTEASEVGVFSALEAPHRIADAVFLASEIEEVEDGGRRVTKPFRHPKDPAQGSKIGRGIDQSSTSNATALFGLCPTALIFGTWDSHGARGGLGEKFQRALVSEIIGIGATEDNRRPTSRIDPLIPIAGESLPIAINEDKSWAVAEKGNGKSRLSEVGLGNVTPSLRLPRSDQFNHGGVTVQFARQIAVLSLPALRRLRFPLSGKRPEEQREVDVAAWATLAALGLAALARQWVAGFSLRSRCDLVPRRGLLISLISAGHEEPFALDVDAAASLLRTAARQAREVGLPWPADGSAPEPWRNGCLTLKPNRELAKAVAQSRRLAAEQRE